MGEDKEQNEKITAKEYEAFLNEMMRRIILKDIYLMRRRRSGFCMFRDLIF